MMKIMTILGIRPDFIRMSEIIKWLDASPRIQHVLVHSGQHYSHRMDGIFFEEMNLRRPDYNCDVGSGSHGEQAARVIAATEPIILKERPHVCLFLGDANPTLAAIAAAKANVKVAHIEAGMRSFDWRMPEEKNRTIVDHISDYLYVYAHRHKEHLLLEGISTHKIFVTGNPIVDIVEKYREEAVQRSHVLLEHGFTPHRYVLVTLHRQENVDDPIVLGNLVRGLTLTAERLRVPLFFPTSYRTAKQLQRFGINVPSSIRQTEPLGFMDFLAAEAQALLIITDSGTVQEESSILNVPCVVARMSTERPETIEVGGCILAGTDPETIACHASHLVDGSRAWRHILGDGCTSARIARHLEEMEEDIVHGDPTPPYVDQRRRLAFAANVRADGITGGGWCRPRTEGVEEAPRTPGKESVAAREH